MVELAGTDGERMQRRLAVFRQGTSSPLPLPRLRSLSDVTGLRLSAKGFANPLRKARRRRRVKGLPAAGSLVGRAMLGRGSGWKVVPVAFQHPLANLFRVEAEQRAARKVREGGRPLFRCAQPGENLHLRSDGHPRIEEIVQ